MDNFAAAVQPNQDRSRFTVSTASGFAVYNALPVREICRREIGGVSATAMLFCSNILAIVGGGRSPFEARNRVVLWDDKSQSSIMQIEYKTPVLNMSFRRDRFVVVLIDEIHIYRVCEPFELQHMHGMKTAENPHGVFALCPHPSLPLLVMPGRQKGHVHVEDLRHEERLSLVAMIVAHQHTLAVAAITRTGERVATASEHGTLLRIFDVASKNLLFEFRRGFTSAKILSMSFTFDGSMLCASTDFSIHVFQLGTPRGGPDASQVSGGGSASAPAGGVLAGAGGPVVLGAGRVSSAAAARAATTAASFSAAAGAAGRGPAEAAAAGAGAGLGTSVGTSGGPPGELAMHLKHNFEYPLPTVCFWTSDPASADRLDKLVVVRSDHTWRLYECRSGRSVLALEQAGYGRLVKPDPLLMFRE